MWLLSGAAAAVDLTGKWRFESTDGGPSQLVQMTQTGNALSFTYYGFAFSGTVTSGAPFSTYSATATSPYTAGIGGRVTPSGNLLDGRLGAEIPPGPPIFGGAVATRCTCDDGNTVTGDGCDVACQVEPCWTCAGDPSVCTPVPDGGACEDGSVCTTGETCTGGACGNGTPVAGPCTDMSGRWHVHHEVPGQGTSYEFATDITQRGSDLVFRAPDSGRPSYSGTIDPATGAFDVRAVNEQEFCPAFDPVTGSVAATGETYTATGSTGVPDPNLGDVCNQFEVTQRGSRHCGSGTIELAEECDDGNLVTGDGCSADCRIEQCWTCNGAPSTCAPQAGGTCDDSDPCTTDDRCTGGGTCVGAPLACEPCFACTAGSCVPATQAPCKASVRPDQSFVLLQTSNNDNRDRITWTWKNGAATAVPELGDPPGGDGYTLCVYDESGPAAALVFRATVPGGGACQTGPCWRPTGKTGFKYGNVAGTPDGVLVTRLIPGDVGKARVELRAKGAHLSGRPYGLPMVPPPMPLRVQLHSESGLCVETRHGVGSVVRNDVAKGLFRARGIP